MKSDIQLIFDFDGTLVDSFDAFIEKFNGLADTFSFRKVQFQEIERLRALTSKELVKYLKIPIYKIPGMLLQLRRQMHNEMQRLLPFANIPETLERLYGLNVPMGILTSNSEENVRAWLKSHKMQHLFRFIHVESSYFGKKRILKKILKAYQIDPSQAFYIGDETRDIEAAKACNISAVAVAWGFNSSEILSQHQPHYMVEKPEDILALTKIACRTIKTTVFR